MTVADWLRQLGLERYETAFADNAVTFDLLPHLSAQDLRDIGVLAVGDRRRLLGAIAKLRGFSEPAVFDAERRQVTVMFCDMTDSTWLSTTMDPEDLSAVIRDYQSRVASTIERFDGFIARYVGDGVLTYFGYPHAHEDDAERAVRAALSIIAEFGGETAPLESVRVRIGIATGLVVVGEQIGEGEAWQQTAIGETPNLAARLQALAAPNTVVIAPSTHRLVGDLFEYRQIGPLALKGLSEPVIAWEVTRPSAIESRFEALRRDSSISLVGRDHELRLLLGHWARSRGGEGQVVLLSGEAGIGKSRLVATLRQQLKDEPHLTLRFFCSPYDRDSAFRPFINQLERALGWTRDDTTEQKQEKLRSTVFGAAHGEDEIALLAELLSLPNSVPDLQLSTQRKREKLFGALIHQLEARARTQSILMIFEDAHWTDPTSLDLLKFLMERVARLPVMLIITFRPEFEHDWGDQPHIARLALNRLDDRNAKTLVRQLAGRELGPEIADEIIARADGVPLFVEELTKTVLETDGHKSLPSSVFPASASGRASVPASLQASLIARFDRLGSRAREVAQLGAVLGREFSYELIDRTGEQSAAELQLGLRRLVDAGLLFCRGEAPQSTYVFKHALVQDAAYSTLLRSRRQQLHARVAAVMAEYFKDIVTRQPEILAYHLTEAGEGVPAVAQWLKAGQHATGRSAYIEAIRHFDRGLEVLKAIPEGPERERQELALQLNRGPALFAAKGFAAAEAAEAYTRAYELAATNGDIGELFTAVNGLWQSANGAGVIANCRRLSGRLQELAADAADDALQLQAHHSAWATSLYSGEPLTAREHAAHGRRLFDPERHRLQHQLYGGHDPGSCAYYLGAQAEWQLGFPDTALRLCEEGVDLARRSAHPFSCACALQYHALLHLDRGEPQSALQQLEAAEKLATEERLGFVLEPQLVRGAALTDLGSLDEAVSCLQQGLTGRNGATRQRCFGLSKLAAALIATGEYEAALTAAQDGLSTGERTGQMAYQSELYRLQGAALSRLKRAEEAEAAFENALREARARADESARTTCRRESG